MAVKETEKAVLNELLQSKLAPFVRQIDAEAYYARDYLVSLGKSSFLQSNGLTEADVLETGAKLVEETSKVCMTTGFNLWCHLAALTYLRHSDNAYLKKKVLPKLENGSMMGATGLSNPMKYYAGLEKLNLQAERVDGGYTICGHLRAVSNLGADHCFGIIAKQQGAAPVMAMIPCDAPGLKLTEKVDYLGLNGSATYSCVFKDVFVPDRWIIAENADSFVPEIRSAFVLYQVPLGFGVTDVSIQAIGKLEHKQSRCNAYLPVQADHLRTELEPLRHRFYTLIQSASLSDHWSELLRIRLDTVYVTLKAVQARMLHQGGPAYYQYSHASRRLREAYFFANLTPTVRHLEKMLHAHSQ